MNKIKYISVSALSILHQTITHFTGNNIFTAEPSSNIIDYTICKICALIASWLIYYLLWQLFIDKNGIIREKNRQYNLVSRICIAALPYLFVMIFVCAFKLRGGYLSNDEYLIYENAVNLTHYTWFYYITTYYYIISLMILPHMYAPIFIKLIIEYLIIGYTMIRSSDYFYSKCSEPLIKKPVKIGYGAFIMILFLLYPVIAYTTSAHRLPIYFLVYLLMIVILLFDKLEQRYISIGRLMFLLFLGSVLTQWRTEGIYLVVLLPILVYITYPYITIKIPRYNNRDKKSDAGSVNKPSLFTYEKKSINLKQTKIFPIVLIIYILLQYLVSIPQNGLVAKELAAAADDRMKPFYAYTITNMYRNGLDLKKNADDLAIVDKYLSLEKIKTINDYYKDINYEDVLILYKPEFIGVRETAGVTEYYDFANALKRIFKNNPNILIRTRIGAFVYAALPYHITFNGFDIRSLITFFVSIIKTTLYNLFIPLIIMLFIFLYSFVRNRWFSFFTTGGLLIHWFIVFILAPASYFKYYFPVYITAYFYLILIIISGIHNKKHSAKIKILQ
ncbi:MAG: hypothetical protein K6E98_12240 [Lachnospiraceae bacterium]|nr:hypothetical protein [Lachnospiraceae bacterium]